ncbi:MAG TPA: hypothetical protein VNM38_03265 [Solirubrobacterales bacterium]|nr:hypothetical protein [Solirubrobacterales bacterium]
MFPTELITPSGDGVAFMSFNGPLGEVDGLTGTLDVTETQRTAGGWQITRRFSPGGEEAVAPIPGGISPDHLYAFTNVAPVFKPGDSSGTLSGGTLAADGQAEYLSNPDGSFDLVGIGSQGVERMAQGRYISASGEHVIFSTGRLESGSYRCFQPGASCPVRQLEANAPPEGTGAIYDREADGPTRVVSLLPGDDDPTPAAGEDAAYEGASKDGTTVAFKIGGVLYARVPDMEDGHTWKVTDGSTAYAGLSDDGRYLFYVAGGEEGVIHRFDTVTKADVAINPAAEGEVVNVSTDGSRVYFISESQIGGQGEAGQPNLYVWSGGVVGYVTTVIPSDLVKTSNFGTEEADFTVGIPALTNWTDWAVTPNRNGERGPGAESSRATPDGKVLIFESRAKLTAYDNGGHTEIYRWDDEVKILDCVSCNKRVGSAGADARLQLLTLLPPPNVVRNLNDDGSRVFFETPEALLAEDVDGVNDIYQWRPEQGGGGALSLISSGKSSAEVPPLAPEPLYQPKPNVIFGITPNGSDVVFLSQDELVPGAGSGGTPALYDARLGGGFSVPVPLRQCVEEECHPSGAASPNLQDPRSESTRGKGNVKPRKHRCRHHSKKHKKPHRCIKRNGKKRKAQASASGAGAAMSAPAAGAAAVAASESPTDSASASLQPAAVEDFEEFGIETVSAEATTAEAAEHPDVTTRFVLNHFVQNGIAGAAARTEDISVKLPPGLLGDPTAVGRCSTRNLLAFGNCPLDSQIGVAKVLAYGLSEFTEPVYNLAPPHPDEEVARLGFIAGVFPVYIDIKVRTAGDYGVTAVVHQGPGQTSLIAATTTLWGDPTDPSHDEQRLLASEALLCPGTACLIPEGKREVPRTGLAFMTNPSACQPMNVGFEVTSYQLPGQVFDANAPMKPIMGCTGRPFAPIFSAEPTNHVAGAPTGLKTNLVIPQHQGADEPGTATMKEARITLPKGMQIAAGAANWIGTCSEGQVGFHEEVEAACPDRAKLGTATIISPALPKPLQGALYQRTPPPGHQFGLWLVTDELGLHVKLPGELQPDPQTGRLTAVFADLPQVPVEEIRLDVWGGPRAPLENPDVCGTYTTSYVFAPHSQDLPVSGQSQMTIDRGCNQGFSPKLRAGTTKPVAARFSPLVVDLSRADDEQQLEGFRLTLPDGLLAKLRGVQLCPESVAASAGCPTGSKIGRLAAAVGPGSEPLWVPQPGKTAPSVYLGGPYEGLPFSIITAVPAQAGPFDLGTVVVRSGLGLDPDTNRAVVEADPLPQFFEGVGLTYRRLHVVIDRPRFVLNPTDCREMQVTAEARSTQGAVGSSSARFQVDGCRRLKFAPKLDLQLSGGTRRTEYPALKAIVKARKGDANLGKVSVALPRSEFLAQEHLGTICTRKRFAARNCPKRSIYGRAKAWTPLLAKPLSGPVYLRSSDNTLPDLVMALGGELEVNLVGRIDSKNQGIRTTFEAVPDAPITKFVLKMRGGEKSLLVNSTDICRGTHRALVVMKAQNGRRVDARPALRSSGCRHKAS